MKINIWALVVILAFTFAALGQAKAPKGFDIRYDKFKDATSVSFGSYGTLIFERFGFDHKGTSLDQDQDEFYLMFTGTRASCTGFCFKGGTDLILLIDGERVIAGTDGRLSDYVYFYVKRSLIEQLAAAKLVEYQVGRFEGKWEAKTLSKFKTLLDLGSVQKPAR